MPHINSQSYWENVLRMLTKKEVKPVKAKKEVKLVKAQVEAKKEAPLFSQQQLQLQMKLLETPQQPSKEQLQLQTLLLQTSLVVIRQPQHPIPSDRLQRVSQQAPTTRSNQPSNIDKPKQKSKKKKFNFEEQEVKKKKITYLTTLTFFFFFRKR